MVDTGAWSTTGRLDMGTKLLHMQSWAPKGLNVINDMNSQWLESRCRVQTRGTEMNFPFEKGKFIGHGKELSLSRTMSSIALYRRVHWLDLKQGQCLSGVSSSMYYL